MLLTGDGELPPADLVGPLSHLAKREAILGVFRHAFRDLVEAGDSELRNCVDVLNRPCNFDPRPALRPALLQRVHAIVRWAVPSACRSNSCAPWTLPVAKACTIAPLCAVQNWHRRLTPRTTVS